jgi:hypothetical protein
MRAPGAFASPQGEWISEESTFESNHSISNESLGNLAVNTLLSGRLVPANDLLNPKFHSREPGISVSPAATPRKTATPNPMVSISSSVPDCGGGFSGGCMGCHTSCTDALIFQLLCILVVPGTARYSSGPDLSTSSWKSFRGMSVGVLYEPGWEPDNSIPDGWRLSVRIVATVQFSLSLSPLSWMEMWRPGDRIRRLAHSD